MALVPAPLEVPRHVSESINAPSISGRGDGVNRGGLIEGVVLPR